MDDVINYLSDEFVSFSGNIAAIHEEKKRLTAEFKETYAKFQAEVVELDKKATELLAEFENWKTEERAKKKK